MWLWREPDHLYLVDFIRVATPSMFCLRENAIANSIIAVNLCIDLLLLDLQQILIDTTNKRFAAFRLNRACWTGLPDVMFGYRTQTQRWSDVVLQFAHVTLSVVNYRIKHLSATEQTEKRLNRTAHLAKRHTNTMRCLAVSYNVLVQQHRLRR